MKSSSIISACVGSLLVAVVVVQAGAHYNPRHSNYPANRGNYLAGPTRGHGHHSALVARPCAGYNCNSVATATRGHQSAHGPYHSYAVRPAVYGGHGLYRYRGYARGPANLSSPYRQVRSPCSTTGYNCHRAAPLNFHLRPVNALVVHPVYRPSRNAGYRHSAPARHLGAAATSGYGRGHLSSGYAPTNHNLRQHARRQPAGY